MEAMLSGRSTKIFSVPVLGRQKFESQEALLAFLTTQSAFCDENVEGVYLRIEDEEYLQERCKVVNPAFIQGISDHWMRHTLVKNTLSFDY